MYMCVFGNMDLGIFKQIPCIQNLSNRDMTSVKMELGKAEVMANERTSHYEVMLRIFMVSILSP